MVIHATFWCAGPNRKLFLPDGLMPRNAVPNYLNGELAGDYGYDPLGLGANGNVEKYRNAELIHARWAMLAAAGIIIPEGLQANGAPLKGGVWFETGAEMLNGAHCHFSNSSIVCVLPIRCLTRACHMRAARRVAIAVRARIHFFLHQSSSMHTSSSGFARVQAARSTTSQCRGSS
jgi:Chlorophyll A-B binding protein